MLKRFLIFLSYGLHFFRTGDSNEGAFYCNAGLHDWGDGKAERGSKRDESVKVVLANGEYLMMAQYVTKGVQSCKRLNCKETRKAYQITLISPMEREKLDRLSPKDRKRAEGGSSKWMRLSPEEETKIDRLPR